MMTRKKANGWLWVLALFAVCTVVYGLLSSYPRELAVYSDEVRYLDVARSLWQGRGLRVRNMPSDYQKILYPLCILPALALKTTAAQVTAIGWLNAAWASSAVFPAYALCRATGQTRRRTVFLVGVTAALPTMAACATFMSETVFLPLSLWMVYFLWRAMAAPDARRRAAWCALAGAFCWLLYLNKEVALYWLIAWVGLRLWVVWQDRAAWRGELAATAALLGAFAGCFVLAKLTLFAGLGNSYNQTGWITAEQWAFLPFAVVCDTLFTVLAFGVFPVLVPLCALRRPRPGTDPRRTQLPLLLLLALGVGVGVVAWSITVREDLGSDSPRQHMRYLEPLLIPLLLVTMDALDHLTPVRRRLLAGLTAVWGVGFVVFCRDIGAGAGDNTFLQWFDFVADRLDRLPVLSFDGWLLVWRLVIVAGAAILGLALVRRKARRGLAVAAVALCVLCYAGEWRINRWAYGIDESTMQAASDLNDSLKNLEGTVLFLPDGVRQRDSQLIDTYIDRDVYLCEYETLTAWGLLEDGVLDLTTEAPGPEYPGRPYEDLTGADWVLVSDTVPLDTTRLEPTDIPCPAGYTLWHNPDPVRLWFTR